MLILAVVLEGCATLPVYPVRVLHTKEHMLYAHDPKDDLPESVCDDTPQSKANCYVLLRADYIRWARDFAEKDANLKACQKGN